MGEKSNIVEVPVQEASDIKWLVNYFDKHKIYQKPKTALHIKTETTYSSVMVSGLLLVVGMALLILEEKGRFKSIIKRKEASLLDFRNQLSHAPKHTSIEKLIEKRYNIDILIDRKELPKTSASDLDDIFGMWKGKKISLEKIREEQWARKR